MATVGPAPPGEFFYTLSLEQREKLVAKLEGFKKWHGPDWE
jgi:hypothetical protein